MKPLLLIAIAATLTLSFLSPDAFAAKGGSKGTGKIPKAKPTPVPEKVNASGPKISKVSGDSITIDSSKTSVTYKMSNETQISIDGKRVRSTDLRPGMRAEVLVSNIHPNLLISIQASAVPKS